MSARGKPRRIITQAIAFLILGAIVNVAVAWIVPGWSAGHEQIRYGWPALTIQEDWGTWLPAWPGFAINSIFYAAILWLLFTAPGIIRKRRRLKRGLCPACAYPIGSSEVCTECGALVKSRILGTIALATIVSMTNLMAGCGIYRYHPTRITVTNAQTGEPMAGVPLQTSYQADLPGIINMPRIDRAITDASGHAVISIASWKSNHLWAGNRLFWVGADELKKPSELTELSSWRLRPDDAQVRVIIAPAR